MESEMLEHQVNVHSKIEMDEEKEGRLLHARWTIINPDNRCEKSDTKSKTEDMFMLHEDDVHYSLMAYKTHDLFKRSFLPTLPEAPASWAQVAAQAPAHEQAHWAPSSAPGETSSHTSGMIPFPACNICSFQFSNNYSLQEHIKITHKEEQNMAQVSQTQSTPAVNIPQSGVAASETPAPVLPTPLSPLMCNFCKFTFSNRKSLQGHMKIAHLEKQDLVKRLEESNKIQQDMSNELDKAFTEIRHKTEETEKLKIKVKLLEDLKELSKPPSPPVSSPVTFVQVAPSTTQWTSAPNQEVFSCEHCQITCSSKILLTEHIQLTHIVVSKPPSTPAPSLAAVVQAAPSTTQWTPAPNQEVFSCEPCQFTCSSKIQLTEHLRLTHINIPKFKCKRCPLEFKSNKDLKEHTDASHKINEGKQYSCFDCDFQDNNRDIFMNHRRIEHSKKSKQPDENGFKCRNCGEVFELKWQLMEHRRIKHPEMRRPCFYDAENKCSFSAYLCWYKHKSETNTQNNQEMKTSEDTQQYINGFVEEIICFFCPQKFKGKNEVMRHRKTVHLEKCKPCVNYVAGNCSRIACWFAHGEAQTEIMDFPRPITATPPP